MSKYNKLKLFFFITVILTTLVVLYRMFFRSVPEIESDAVKSSAVEIDRPEELRTQKVHIDKKRYELLYQKIQKYQIEHEDEEENEVSPLSDRERAKESILLTAIRPHFFEQAPKTLDRLLSQQSENELWTRILTEELETKLEAEELSGSKMLDLTCYQTMCKIVMQHTDTESQNQFVEHTTFEGGLHGPSHEFSKPTDDNMIESYLYVGRYGDDYHVHQYLYEQMYEEVTGKSADSIEPTDEQIRYVAEYNAEQETNVPQGSADMNLP